MSKSHAYQAGRPIYIVDGSRTPFLRAAGRPNEFSASDLAVAASRPMLARQPIEPMDLDEVVLGCAMPSSEEANIGRILALRLGCGNDVPGWTVMRFANVPLKAFMNPVIALINGLNDFTIDTNMGQTCEIVAHRFGITREQMDEYAVRSHLRLAKAFDDGLMEEIATLYSPKGKVFDEDTGLRRDSSTEKLAKLKAVFDRKVGVVTPGNSSQITDGSAMLLLASEEAVRQHDLQPLGVLIDAEWAALDPAEMGLGPVHASTPLMQRHQLGLNDIDVWEINEAFAGQVLGCLAACARRYRSRKTEHQRRRDQHWAPRGREWFTHRAASTARTKAAKW